MVITAPDATRAGSILFQKRDAKKQNISEEKERERLKRFDKATKVGENHLIGEKLLAII